MTDLLPPAQLGRSARLEAVLSTLLATAPELEAAAVVSFDGLPMASSLPAGMDEDRLAAMSAALLSLGDRAAQGLGRGDLSQVYVEGEHGTVFLVSADDEAVLVAVAAKAAKIGMMLFEVRRAAHAVAAALVADDLELEVAPYVPLLPVPEPDGLGGVPAPSSGERGEAVAVVPPPPPQVAVLPQVQPPPYVGAPVMAPVPTASHELAPDGLAWPQLPSTDTGWS